MPGTMSGMMALMKRDIALAVKRPGDVLNPLFFFAMVATLFPLAVGPGEAQLQFSGPGVLWVAALLDQYYDAMYDYQLSQRAGQVLFRGGRDEIVQWVGGAS